MLDVPFVCDSLAVDAEADADAEADDEAAEDAVSVVAAEVVEAAEPEATELSAARARVALARMRYLAKPIVSVRAWCTCCTCKGVRFHDLQQIRQLTLVCDERADVVVILDNYDYTRKMNMGEECKRPD